MQSYSLIGSVAVNAILVVGLLAMMSGSNNVGSSLAMKQSVSRGSMMRSPAPTFRSAVANAYCEEVVDPATNTKYEAMSYLNEFTERDMEAQVSYMLNNGLIPCIEFDSQNDGKIFRENSQGPTYYDGRYWTMWKLPMFGAQDARDVMHEVRECKKYNPNAFIRILGFDNIKQVQCMGFLVSRPQTRGSYF
mmetsp:Transcript_4363/g.8741  ORF Transcript_4363/g.8741 Transcript_4363/m.8741 type:complete len:191 (-) Transcript_4363:225-797(-)|eukprot:CAMPEP_0170198430 /NCGR_PEP_ID=MMETSP0040_2-20121228/68755_1 /TAXON_ID=641309 /ORGANISM="Lotharella oceanica, Strain CCMP622" /LENGTH=190 /DNA_ID=CAMNT_0010448399 /DNA_START=1484 /DNA_END=2056 /DNA_ORIENTATION=-